MAFDDLRKLIGRFFTDDGFQVMSLGAENNFDEIDPYINNFYTFDRPDGFSKINNTILIMEHFEFDSACNIYKGSENRKELARISREAQEKFSNGNNSSRDVIKCTYSIQNYIKNVTKEFMKHYHKIPSYKEHLKLENIINNDTEIKVMFLIEDTTTLPNLDNKNGNPITLVKCDKFLDLFEKHKEVDYILCFSEYNQQKITYFLSQSSIEDYRKNEIKVNEIEIIDWEPQVNAYNFEINPH